MGVEEGNMMGPRAAHVVVLRSADRGGQMSRYASDLRTSMSRDEAWGVISGYLTSEGFEFLTERGANVWRKGQGIAGVPQFVSAIPADGSVHLEAWLSQVAWVPGVYTGEQDLEGVWGFAFKKALKTRVVALQGLLGGNIVSQGKIASPVAGSPAPAAMAPQTMTPQAVAAPQTAAAAPATAPGVAPAAWSPDPSGRHELRYWDGAKWTDHVSDHGATSQDAL
jgi:hypothetical protein